MYTANILLTPAAIVGDTVNYRIGKEIGPKAFKSDSKLFRKEHLEKTHAFSEKHGRKTIIIATFIPIIRTFASFVAGIGTMTYSKFLAYNVAGGVLWCTIFIYGGYYFGNISFVQNNYSLVIIAIIFIPVLPGIPNYLMIRLKKSTP